MKKNPLSPPPREPSPHAPVDFHVAGSPGGKSEERTLAQVVFIATYKNRLQQITRRRAGAGRGRNARTAPPMLLPEASFDHCTDEEGLPVDSDDAGRRRRR